MEKKGGWKEGKLEDAEKREGIEDKQRKRI